MEGVIVLDAENSDLVVNGCEFPILENPWPDLLFEVV